MSTSTFFYSSLSVSGKAPLALSLIVLIILQFSLACWYNPSHTEILPSCTLPLGERPERFDTSAALTGRQKNPHYLFVLLREYARNHTPNTLSL